MPGIESIRADGPNEVGTALTFRTRGKDQAAKIATVDPGTSITLRSVQSGFTADYLYEVRSSEVGSEVSLTADCTSSGVRSVFGPLLRWVIKRSDSSQISNLKTMVEA